MKTVTSTFATCNDGSAASRCNVGDDIVEIDDLSRERAKRSLRRRGIAVRGGER